MSTTYRFALNAAHALQIDRLDAQLLMLHALGKTDQDRAWLIAHDDESFEEPLLSDFNELIQRRTQGEPLAYIVGYKEFFGLTLSVDKHVLIPRPDTETLVHWALDTLLEFPRPDVLDLGTGSGAVAIAIAIATAHKLKSTVTITATDNSENALKVASQNAHHLGAIVQFLRSHWFEKISGQYHLIVSNPPYIASSDAHLAALVREPLGALTAGADGLNDIRQIVQNAPLYLRAGGWLMLEHGYDQASAVRELLTQRGFAQVRSRLDFGGNIRCSGGQWG